VVAVLFLVTLAGQAVAGWLENNQELLEHGLAALSLRQYLGSSGFLEATMENWESEFLQMGMYVVLTAMFYQTGSSESKKLDEPEAVDRPPKPTRSRDVPWPVRRGGLALKLYQHSLSIAFFLLFALSFALHAVGGAGEYNQEQLAHGSAEQVTAIGYLATSRFWFESLQNWQSEFLAILAMVVLSIFLRQRGSPESKPVDAAHSETGT
jgi:hypothetical protein